MTPMHGDDHELEAAQREVTFLARAYRLEDKLDREWQNPRAEALDKALDAARCLEWCLRTEREDREISGP